jgi:RND family efflux transporter MFP subunit
MKKIMIGMVVILLASLLGLRIIQKFRGSGAGAKSGPLKSTTLAVAIQPVCMETIRDHREFTGSISPQSQFIIAPKVAGRLEKLRVNIGQEVKNGDLIVQIDSLEYTQQVEQARAELDVARANVADSQSALDIAQREGERAQELRKQKVASESELDQAEARYRAALAKHAVTLAQVKQREAALKADEVRLSYTQITATWEGDSNSTRVVGERFVDEGAMLRANEPIVTILDVRTVIATIYIIERDYPNIQVGQQAVITTDAFPGQTFHGAIVRKAPLLKESSRQARVEIEVDNTDRRLAPGMFVRAEIEFALHENATVVPAAALVRRNGYTGVFLADLTAMKARFVSLTTGIVNGERAEILTPPLTGQVITLGQHLLEDGALIVLPPAPEAPGTQPDQGTRR